MVRCLSCASTTFGLQRDDGLASQINLTMERIRSDGTWQQLYDTWLGAFLPGGYQPEGVYEEVSP